MVSDKPGAIHFRYFLIVRGSFEPMAVTAHFAKSPSRAPRNGCCAHPPRSSLGSSLPFPSVTPALPPCPKRTDVNNAGGSVLDDHNPPKWVTFACRFTNYIKDFNPERNTGDISQRVYINATSTPTQKNSIRVHSRALAGIRAHSRTSGPAILLVPGSDPQAQRLHLCRGEPRRYGVRNPMHHRPVVMRGRLCWPR